ncbi:hypothetical protein BHE74_00002831, partial [Ensete ventricosum]
VGHEEKEMKVSFSGGVKKTWPSFLPPPLSVVSFIRPRRLELKSKDSRHD